MTQYEFEREHYRIVYPSETRPRFSGEGLLRDITDLSERGLGYLAATGEVRQVGDEVEGQVRVHRGGEVPVRGKVVRVSGRLVALRLADGIPLQVVLEEQRHLRELQRGSE